LLKLASVVNNYSSGNYYNY